MAQKQYSMALRHHPAQAKLDVARIQGKPLEEEEDTQDEAWDKLHEAVFSKMTQSDHWQLVGYGSLIRLFHDKLNLFGKLQVISLYLFRRNLANFSFMCVLVTLLASWRQVCFELCGEGGVLGNGIRSKDRLEKKKSRRMMSHEYANFKNCYVGLQGSTFLVIIGQCPYSTRINVSQSPWKVTY